MLLDEIITCTDANISNRDTDGETVTIPALVGQDLWTKYDWNFSTTAQTYLDKGQREFNSGRAVGGSSILNGLVWTRGAKSDYDAWETLGNPGWGWKGLLPYFEKVIITTKRPISLRHVLIEMLERNLHVSPGGQYHKQSSCPSRFPGTWTEWTCPSGIPQLHLQAVKYVLAVTFVVSGSDTETENFLQGIASLGVPLLDDPNRGFTVGASIAPSSIHPLNQSRSDARTAYLDSNNLENLHIATEQTVTRILLEKNNGSNTTSPVPPFGYLRRAFGVEVSSFTANDRRFF